MRALILATGILAASLAALTAPALAQQPAPDVTVHRGDLMMLLQMCASCTIRFDQAEPAVALQRRLQAALTGHTQPHTSPAPAKPAATAP